MPRIHAEEENSYQSGGNSEWFKLANHMDVARVQFMFNTAEDIERFAVHQVEVNGKKRYVNCLKTYDQPVEMCPFCAAGLKVLIVKFVIMFQHDDQKVKIWERGKAFIDKLQSQMNRYGGNGDFENHVFEIERHGAAGDKNTVYELFHMDAVEPYDLNEADYPEIDGGLVMNKTFDEMETYLNTGRFPDDDGGSNPPPESARRDTGRRVPANNPPTATPRRGASAPAAAPPTPPPASSRRQAAAAQPGASTHTNPPAADSAAANTRGSRRGRNDQEIF